MVVQPVGVDIFNAAFSGDVAVPLTNRSDGTGTGPTVMQPYTVGNTLTARMAKGINSTLDEGQNPIIALQDITPREKAQNGKGWNDDGTAYTVDTHATQGVAQPTYAIQGSMIGRNDNAGPQGDGINEEVCFTQNCVDRHAVAQPMPINTMVALRHEALGERTGFGIGDAGDPAYTLTKGHSHAVAQPIILMDQGGSVMNVEHDMVGTLRRETHGHEPVVAVRMVAFGKYFDDGTASAMKARDYKDATDLVAQPIGFDSYNHAVTGDVSKTLDVGQDYHHVPNLLQAMQVRRLTPVECERLQGFPDNYTNIPWRKKPEAPDGPRYKALGNSWAVPVVRWIGERIAKAA